MQNLYECYLIFHATKWFYLNFFKKINIHLIFPYHNQAYDKICNITKIQNDKRNTMTEAISYNNTEEHPQGA